MFDQLTLITYLLAYSSVLEIKPQEQPYYCHGTNGHAYISVPVIFIAL